MRIKFLLFALYRDLVGAEELELVVPPGSTAADAVTALRARGGGSSRLPERPVVAINRIYAGLDEILSDNDELALLPPVAGG
ncbi:MAG: MoaD/ThiS family protein [Longimicrobiales bacterium]